MSDYLEQDRSSAVTKYYNAQAIGLLGLVTWELIVTTPFEWKYVKLRFRPHWSIVLYTGTRLSLFAHIFAIVVNVFDHEAVPCNAQAWLLHISASLVIWLAAANLSLRVLNLWTKIESILGALGVMLAGLLVINCLTWQTPDMVWDSAWSRCVARTGVHKALTLVQYFYTFTFYFIITAIFAKKSLPELSFQRVKRLFLHDGLGIFVLVTLVFLCQAVVAATWTDDIVIVIFLPAALTITTIAVSRSYVNIRNQIEGTKPVDKKKIPLSRPTSTWTQPAAATTMPRSISAWKQPSSYSSAPSSNV